VEWECEWSVLDPRDCWRVHIGREEGFEGGGREDEEG
jgi:hypothetical protein